VRFPSKNTRFADSIIAKFPAVLGTLQNGEMPVAELYKTVRHITEDLGEFIQVLDCLYALGKLELNAETRSLRIVS
jgi:hypothetical protein